MYENVCISASQTKQLKFAQTANTQPANNTQVLLASFCLFAVVFLQKIKISSSYRSFLSLKRQLASLNFCLEIWFILMQHCIIQGCESSHFNLRLFCSSQNPILSLFMQHECIDKLIFSGISDYFRLFLTDALTPLIIEIFQCSHVPHISQ